MTVQSFSVLQFDGSHQKIFYHFIIHSGSWMENFLSWCQFLHFMLDVLYTFVFEMMVLCLEETRQAEWF